MTMDKRVTPLLEAKTSLGAIRRLQGLIESGKWDGVLHTPKLDTGCAGCTIDFELTAIIGHYEKKRRK